MSDPAKKLPTRLEPRATTSTRLAPQSAPTRSTYAAVMARARAAGLAALCTIAPLGALAGTVSACGAAAPVQPNPYRVQGASDPNAVVAPPTGAGTTPAPLTSIAPPATNAPPQPTPKSSVPQ